MILSNINDAISKTVFKHKISSILRNVRMNIAKSGGEINLLIFNDVIHAYRKYFQKLLKHEITE